jgi:hypothetical protein
METSAMRKAPGLVGRQGHKPWRRNQIEGVAERIADVSSRHELSFPDDSPLIDPVRRATARSYRAVAVRHRGLAIKSAPNGSDDERERRGAHATSWRATRGLDQWPMDSIAFAAQTV